jgi:hypothetical protein
MKNFVKFLVVFGCFLTVLGVDDRLVYEKGHRVEGESRGWPRMWGENPLIFEIILR